ncbi:MAG: polyketide cyclase [Alphaproteobacteria bacterium BRH_c36]|nr:MAG: polyketide cyclase [Alphaproteobacteria bacterium BRH_c36]
MLKKILLTLASLIGVFAVYIAVLPSEFSVARSTVIAAPPAAVFEYVNDLQKWDAWSPWAKRDPNSKATFEGPETGRGAIFKWDGNAEVGKGKMRIEESIPPREIEIKLDFERPFEDTADVGFEFEPVEDGTRVTWSIAGEQDYIERVFCTLMGLDMDQMIGNDYEEGLANLKRVVEKAAE